MKDVGFPSSVGWTDAHTHTHTPLLFVSLISFHGRGGLINQKAMT